MKTKLTIFSLIAVVSFALADEHTDAGHVTAKHALTLEGAKQIGEAAMKFAKENGVGPSIAVVDEGGYLLYFVRSEGVSPQERTSPSAKLALRRFSRSPRRN